MGVIKPVIMFNEVAALDGGVNPATAVAIRDCLIWQVSFDRFQVLMEHYPQVGMGLLRVLAARNRLLISHYEDLSFRSVLARTAKLLLDLSQQGDKSIDRREHTNYELAARVGTVPEALSRSLRFFREQGYISGNRASLEVNVPDKLAEQAELDLEFFKG
jgi:CRP-like cAMP-binding protein